MMLKLDGELFFVYLHIYFIFSAGKAYKVCIAKKLEDFKVS